MNVGSRIGLTGRRAIRLDDDLPKRTIGAQLPKIDLLLRSVVGWTGAGDRLLDWVPVAENLVAVSYEERTVVERDHRKMRVKLIVLWGDEEVQDVTDLAVRMTSVAGEEHVYRITEYEQNGFRLRLTGERNL